MKTAIIPLFLIGLTTLIAGDAPTVPYPAQYRSWTHLHASFVGGKIPGFWTPACEKPCTAGVFHFYGNSQAMEGLRTGTYPDGAIIAEELLEILGHESGSGKEGTRRFVGVMVKDSNLYSETGGWGFGKFDAGSKANSLDSKAQKDCFTCHIPRKDKGYVFTEYQER